jgi:hydroxyethylthiazole kinase
MRLPIDTDSLAAAWERFRAARPSVHCITNSVVQGWTANVLLAVGAVPSMTTDPSEIGDFVGRADGLLVNLGTLDAERREAITLAIAAARDGGKPWLLDPVFIDRAPGRCLMAQSLMGAAPTLVRANAAEMESLFGPPSEWARRAGGTTLAVSGGEDRVISARGALTIRNGHAFGGLVTGAGCALSALMTGLAAVLDDAPLAAATAFAAYGLAQELAAEGSAGPGAFSIRLIDALYGLDPATLRQGARLS